MLTLTMLICAVKSVPALGMGMRDKGSGKKMTLMVYMCGSNLERCFGSASAE